ncbi:MAG TPA: hypothetical protein VG651_06575 [Stellaceae bacterium]|nr:hypothetical protein [Stellaceae bacterium]
MRRLLVLLVLFGCLAVAAGCADSSDKNADNNRFGGFYGGINGGAALGR